MIRRTFLAWLSSCFLLRKRPDAVVIPRTTIQEWMEEVCEAEGRKVYFSVERTERGTFIYKRCYF